MGYNVVSKWARFDHPWLHSPLLRIVQPVPSLKKRLTTSLPGTPGVLLLEKRRRACANILMGAIRSPLVALSATADRSTGPLFEKKK